MATIELRISANNSTDLADTLSSLMYLSAYRSELPMENDAAQEPEVEATQDAEPGERQRRTRRTKAQIESDAVAEKIAPAATAASGASASALSPSKTSASDVFGDQLKEVAAEPATLGAVTRDQAMDALRALVEKKDAKGQAYMAAPDIQEIVKAHADGNGSIRTMDEKYLPAVYAALVAEAAK